MDQRQEEYQIGNRYGDNVHGRLRLDPLGLVAQLEHLPTARLGAIARGYLRAARAGDIDLRGRHVLDVIGSLLGQRECLV